MFFFPAMFKSNVNVTRAKLRFESSSRRARKNRVAERPSFFLASLIALLMCSVAWANDSDDDLKVTFDIPQQRADLALTEFAEQADLTLIFPSEVAREESANALIGAYTLQEGADILLRGTGLNPEFSNAVVLSITTDAMSADGGETMNTKKKAGFVAAIASLFAGGVNAQDAVDGDNEDKAETPVEIEEIIVTGTNIRGAENPTVPILKFDSEYFEQSGYTTTADVFRDLPQNFAELSSATAGIALQNGAEFNSQQSTNIDLRGLGSDATLVLMNGRRLVPSGSNSSVDISLIPLSAIERVDILTDGGSAVYGSDAVGGVVNFILKDDYEGAETSLRYSAPTREGGGQSFAATQSAGLNWTGGNAFFAYEYRKTENLTADDRGFSASADDFVLPELFDLVAPSEGQNIIVNMNQDLASRLSFSAYGLYGAAKNSYRRGDDPDEGEVTRRADNDQTSLGLELVYDYSDAAMFTVGGSHNSFDGRSTVDFPATSEFRLFDTQDESYTFDARVSGSVLKLPAGEISYAIGGEYRNQQSSFIAGFDGSTQNDRDQEREVTSAFAEAIIPLFGAANRRLLLESLQLSVAARYDDISDAGTRVTPQIGLSWSPHQDLKIRSSYGESFKAPLLARQSGRLTAALLTSSDPVADNGQTPYILLVGSPPPGELDPEVARSFTTGFDYEPAFFQDFSISASYFNIEFKDRAGRPIVGSIFSVLEREDELAPGVLTRNPLPEEITRLLESAADVVNFSELGGNPFAEFSDAGAIVDERTRNIAKQNISGTDVTVRYDWDSDWGDFGLLVNLNYLFEFDQQDEPSAPVAELVDTFRNPVDLRARTGLTWSRAALNASVFVDYVDSYEEPETGAKINSWTTADFRFAVDLGELFPRSGVVDGLVASFVAQNVFDADPPYVESRRLLQPVGYDPINADPLGRVVALGLTKRW